MSERLRIGTLQYFIRPVTTFEEFEAQVAALVETASDYRCRLLVFPEYFTIQLLTLGDITLPGRQQVRNLAHFVDRYIKLFSRLSAKYKIYIVAGSIPVVDPDNRDKIYNDSHIFGPDGKHVVQGKLHLTRWEAEDWHVSPRKGVKVIDADFGKFAVAICYDSEFPEIARAAARAGCYILVVPSCTDDRQGFLRVRYCCHARAIENTMYVVTSGTVGSLPMVPSVSMNYGQAAILTPSDFPFSRDGILAEGNVNQEMMVIAEVNLDTIAESRENGTVLPLRDSITTAEVTSHLETISL